MNTRCGGCPHAGHKGPCRGKAPSGCTTLACRELTGEEDPQPREWRGTEHTCEYEPKDPLATTGPASS